MWSYFHTSSCNIDNSSTASHNDFRCYRHKGRKKIKTGGLLYIAKIAKKRKKVKQKNRESKEKTLSKSPKQKERGKKEMPMGGFRIAHIKWWC